MNISAVAVRDSASRLGFLATRITRAFASIRQSAIKQLTGPQPVPVALTESMASTGGSSVAGGHSVGQWAVSHASLESYDPMAETSGIPLLGSPSSASTTSSASAMLPGESTLPGEPASDRITGKPLGEEEAAEEIAHMRRRLFRTLEHPERPCFGVDCGSISVEDLRLVTSRFLNEDAERDEQNLVLAVPVSRDFANSEAFDIIQSVKQTAFERGLDGKVSWLLMHEPETELPALQMLIKQQAGSWHAKR